MNEIKRYDQALADQLEHLPMLPEDMAWAEMKKMLDDDDDDRVVVPFFRRFGCLLLGLVAALILSIGGWLYYQKNSSPVSASKHAPGSASTTGSNYNKLPDGNVKPVTADTTGVVTGNTTDTLPVGQSAGTKDGTAVSDSSGSKFSGNKNPYVSGRLGVKVSGAASGNSEQGEESKGHGKKAGTAKGKTKVSIRPAVSSGNGDETGNEPGNTNRNVKQDSDAGRIHTNVRRAEPANDSSVNSPQQKTTDSNTIAKKDTAVKKQLPPVAAAPAQEEKQEKKKYWMLASGLTVYQPIPINGASAVPYNQYGRRGSLTDYIPSAYLRLYRSKKWFIHTEFRYGAPQNVKPFNYKQSIRDSAQMVVRTTFQLNKTYYHQIPFSVHYYVLPNLSVGGGIVYNRFAGAIVDRDIYRIRATGDTLLSSVTLRERNDERFIKKHFQWSAEMQYQWKRFFIGAKYTRDIDPYIKFTDITTGTPVEKKAEAINIFLRYELWRSKKL